MDRNYSGKSGNGKENRAGEHLNRPRRVSVNDGTSRGGGYRRVSRHRVPLAWLIVFDVAAAGVIILVFFITNYVFKSDIGPKPLPIPSDFTSTAVPTLTVSDTTAGQIDETTGQTDTMALETTQGTTQPAALIDPSSWRAKFAGKFTDGAVEKTANTYKSANINVRIDKVQTNGVTYFVADIFVADLKFFRTAFARRPDIMGDREFTDVVAKENDAIIAINGDHCLDNDGPVVRNGQLYRDQKLADALVMNYDGSMQTYSADQLDMNKIKAEGAYQVWTFGPMLLENGQPLTQFNSTLTRANPRTAVGYFEPGHYCFVVVDGRQPGYSNGYTLQELSQLFYNLGCTVAFNLDGGQSSEMSFMGEIVNQAYNGGRSTSDILYIADK